MGEDEIRQREAGELDLESEDIEICLEIDEAQDVEGDDENRRARKQRRQFPACRPERLGEVLRVQLCHPVSLPLRLPEKGGDSAQEGP